MTWNRHKHQLAKIVQAATADLIQFIQKNPTANSLQMEMVFQTLVGNYGLAATESAMLALESTRRAAGMWDVLPTAEPAALPPPEQMSAVFRFAGTTLTEYDAAQLARALAGPLGRLIQQPARQTVYDATVRAGTRYARLPGPKACDFCLMLASRGAVYTSKKAATTVHGKRNRTPATTYYRNPAGGGGHTYTQGRRPEELKFHDNCSCTAIESIHDADVPQILVDLQDEWDRVTKTADGLPMDNQREVWRNHIRNTRPNGTTLPE